MDEEIREIFEDLFSRDLVCLDCHHCYIQMRLSFIMLDFDIVFCYLESDFRGWHPSNMRLDCLDFFTHMCGNCCSIFKIQFLHQTINYLQSIKEHNYLEKTNRYITTTSSLPQFQRMCPTYIFKTFNRRQLFVLIILFIIINNGGSEKG